MHIPRDNFIAVSRCLANGAPQNTSRGSVTNRWLKTKILTISKHHEHFKHTPQMIQFSLTKYISILHIYIYIYIYSVCVCVPTAAVYSKSSWK